MKTCHVKDLMVPLSAYATVDKNATLLEAVLALKKAQTAFDRNRDRHRAVLVIDTNNRIVGKVSQHDVIEALEPNYAEMRKSIPEGSMHRLGFSDDFVKSTMEQYRLWEKALEHLCAKAVNRHVRDIMYTPDKGEFVNVDATLDEAIHRLIIGRHHSLLVTGEHHPREIVGVLRLTDIFTFVGEAMMACVSD